MKRIPWSIIVLIAMLAAAVLAVPGAAAGTASSSPLPVENGMASQKAWLKWKAAERETEMSVSIEYINELNGTTSVSLDALLVKYQEQEGEIPSLSTHAGIDNLLKEMNQVNLQFLQELRNQMKAGHGRNPALQDVVDYAVKDNARFPALESTYWSLRAADERAYCDMRVQRAQDVLANLNKMGYDTTEAQAKLDEITGRRGDLGSALNLHDPAAIRAVQQEILILSKELVQIVRGLQEKKPQGKQVPFRISEGKRAVLRAEMINADLQFLNIDTIRAVEYAAAAKTNLAAAQAALDKKNTEGAEASLEAARKDLKDLAQAYRDIAERYRANASVFSSLTAVAQALEGTAISWGSD